MNRALAKTAALQSMHRYFLVHGKKGHATIKVEYKDKRAFVFGFEDLVEWFPVKEAKEILKEFVEGREKCPRGLIWI